MRKKETEIPKHEQWLFLPENNELLEHVKKALQEDATIDLGSFQKYANDKVIDPA